MNAGLETKRFHKLLVQIQDLYCAWSSVESSSDENEVGESMGLGHIFCLILKIIIIIIIIILIIVLLI